MLKWIAARIGEFRQSSLRDDLLGAFVSVSLAIRRFLDRYAGS
jgi:hypothetical protein